MIRRESGVRNFADSRPLLVRSLSKKIVSVGTHLLK